MEKWTAPRISPPTKLRGECLVDMGISWLWVSHPNIVAAKSIVRVGEGGETTDAALNRLSGGLGLVLKLLSFSGCPELIGIVHDIKLVSCRAVDFFVVTARPFDILHYTRVAFLDHVPLTVGPCLL